MITTTKLLLLFSFPFISYASLTLSQTPLSPTPQDRWQILQPNIGISAMHMQLLHTDTVVIFDRTDFGPSNISLSAGACRFDPNDTALPLDCTAHSVLYDVAANTYRPVMVQTDTWCSSGSVLPNGTLVQTGGFNDGERAIRMFTGCGYEENCNWVEYPRYLYQRRWYATNQILPDGRVIIVGGRKQFNYEFFPSDESSISRVFRFDFLRETNDANAENNLYPFVHLLPNGNLFVFANTRSILFDYRRNIILREFPQIPGEDSRNYPSSGSSVLLPLDENRYSNGIREIDVEIMVCGGAPRGSFSQANERKVFARASSTCGRLKVGDGGGSGGAWEMESMPVARVMGDMLLLPTGDVIIVNGAGTGTAGWENAREPVTRPLIYHPMERRFSVMTSSSRPRMYHSSAVLLSDGRILIGGSNPHVYYNFTNVQYPTDLSLEAYSPIYLSAQYDSIRPAITSRAERLSYGTVFTVSFSVREYLAASVLSVKIVAPSFTTHSLGMNQRMVVLRTVGVSRLGPASFRATVVGPSTAEIAPPGYYMMFVVHARIPSSGAWVKLE